MDDPSINVLEGENVWPSIFEVFRLKDVKADGIAVKDVDFGDDISDDPDLIKDSGVITSVDVALLFQPCQS